MDQEVKTQKKCNTYSRYIHTHFFIPVCPENYTEYPGDVPGWGSIISLPSFFASPDLPSIDDINSCALACDLTPDCCSFEFSQTEVRCNLNTECGPTSTEIYKDYTFCVKGNSCRFNYVVFTSQSMISRTHSYSGHPL